MKEGKEEIKETKVPKLSDFVDMNQKSDGLVNESQISQIQEYSDQKIRKDSFKLCNNEENFSSFNFFSLKRKASLDESMLQKKIKRDIIN